ncbi:unnamed protein product [Acanthoscelides obtectus]|uniref:Uncharacterized protein n=1 Tax=Acanthoscelides obtectus TaxID=200917 RepID=A0A9P0MF25_ACAOB|nr:unnamed protein product [Acanthoscelides obtectus]CAH2011246.1 unnamed protein product [Acanthoscelides obtectus]CAK1646661.1 hypothetical protein AOBTE_LOCUS14797 [Acanthoscelides obtectus]CAK1646928.1 hypothetical protein AOBTE_LOCUS14948 [Acanthoscelides obtectus]
MFIGCYSATCIPTAVIRAFYDGIDNSRRQVSFLNVKVPEDHEFLTKWWMQLDTVSRVLRESPLAEQEVNLVFHSQPYGTDATKLTT